MSALSPNQYYSLLQNLLHGLSRKMKSKISTALMKKHHPGNLHQISNTEGWYQNVLFGGNVLNPC